MGGAFFNHHAIHSTMETLVIEHKKVNLTIAPNGTSDSKTVHLPAGICTGMATLSISAEPDEFVDLSVLDGGSEIFQGQDYRFSQRTSAGKWEDSLRPMTFDCNRTITVQLSSDAQLAAGLKVQVIFLIKRVINL